MSISVGEIASMLGGTVRGDASLEITGLNGIREAGPGELTFVRTARYLPQLETTRASAVLLQKAPENCPVTCIELAAPDLGFARLLKHFEHQTLRHPAGVHATASVGAGATLGADVALDAHVRIAEDAVIGDRAVLYAGVYVGRGATVGDDTVLYPNAVIREGVRLGKRCIVHAGACIGSDGFGFAPLGGQWMKIPQVGVVDIGDDVEIGSNTCVDRATFGTTRIGTGTKIDNLVQIGHNTEIGQHCVIAGTVGIAGSATIGSHVRIGASAGIGGHLDIGDGASIAARAGVIKSVSAGATVSGFPAVEHAQDRRVMVAQQRVPELLRRMRQLERKLEALEKGTA